MSFIFFKKIEKKKKPLSLMLKGEMDRLPLLAVLKLLEDNLKRNQYWKAFL